MCNFWALLSVFHRINLLQSESINININITNTQNTTQKGNNTTFECKRKKCKIMKAMIIEAQPINIHSNEHQYIACVHHKMHYAISSYQ